MKNKFLAKVLVLLLLICLIAALFAGCGNTDENTQPGADNNTQSSDQSTGGNEDTPTVDPTCKHEAITDPAVEPTCTDTGKTEGSHCAKCNEVLTAQEEIPAKGHTLTTSLNCNVCKKTAQNRDYAFYASVDFMKVRSKYSTATPTGAYVSLFVNQEGDVCVLTWVFYKLISSYNVTTLHNLTDGTCIENPEDYYDKLADRYYGADRLHYLSMAGEILKYLSDVDDSAAYIPSSEIIYY